MMGSINKTLDAESHSEFLMLILDYLERNSCTEAASCLAREIEANKLLPPRRDFRGHIHQRSLRDYRKVLPISLVTLESLFELSSKHFLNNEYLPPYMQKLPRRIYSYEPFFRKSKEWKMIMPAYHAKASSSSLSRANPLGILTARELGHSFLPNQLLHETYVRSLDLHCRINGHIVSAFCVAFDRTNQYAITGADDRLIKVWSVHKGLLHFTIRGHGSEISDLSISDDNRLLAAGSNDKTVRVWNLQTGEPVAFYRCHTAAISLIFFSPFVSTRRFLISGGNDCIVNFYGYNQSAKQFENEPISFNERAVNSARIISSAHSAAGTLMAFGDSQRYIHIFKLSENGPEKCCDIEAHKDRVNTLVWAHSGLRFVSGSRDGITKIWKFSCNDWISQSLTVPDTKNGNSRSAYRVFMVCWSLEDDFVVTTGSDHMIRVWCSYKGIQLREIMGHKSDVYVLVPHPLYPHYIYTAGHDGLLLVLDVARGTLVRKYQNQNEGSVNVPIFDLAVSTDGSLVAFVDSYGCITILGVGTNQQLKRMPKEQYFPTDYMPIILDNDGYCYDEETGFPPHLMPPSLLVNADGHFHEDWIQRLIPGFDAVENINIPELATTEPPWKRKPMIPYLPSSSLKIILDRQAELQQREIDNYKMEQVRTKPIKLPDKPLHYSKNANDTIATRIKREKRDTSVREMEEHIEILESSDSGDYSYVFNNSDDGFATESSSSSSQSSESDSDYETEQLRNFRGGRNEARGSNNITLERRRRSTRRRRGIESFDDSVSDADQPGPSGLSQGRILEDSDVFHVPGSSRINGSNRSDSGNRINETFPAWMSMTKPRRFPYVAQLGDEVVYFRQGHEFYLTAVTTQKLYKVSSNMTPLVELDAEEFCIVTEIKYSRRPYRLTTVKLARLNTNQELTGFSFTVKYHDMENVPDFIILRSLYLSSIEQRYQPGSCIETILDNHWWIGTVDKRIAHDERNYPRSNWFCLAIKWDSGEDDIMSPWDLQPQQPGRRSGRATEADLVAFAKNQYSTSDWVGAVQEHDNCNVRLREAIEQLQTLSEVSPFIAPVNLDEYPSYAVGINYPVDLRTVQERMENKFYRRLGSLKQDIRYIAINAELFNIPGSGIVRNSRILVECLIKYLDDASFTNAGELFESLKNLPDSEFGEYTQCTYFPPQSATNSNPTLSHLSQTETNSFEENWTVEFKNILRNLLAEDVSRHFYPSIRNSEMRVALSEEDCPDLKEIEEKIENSQFSNPIEAIDEVKRSMATCRSALDDQRGVIYQESLTFCALFEDRVASFLAKWQRIQQGNSSGDMHSSGDRQQHHVYNTRSHAVNFNHQSLRRTRRLIAPLTRSTYLTRSNTRPSTSSNSLQDVRDIALASSSNFADDSGSSNSGYSSANQDDDVCNDFNNDSNLTDGLCVEGSSQSNDENSRSSDLKRDHPSSSAEQTEKESIRNGNLSDDVEEVSVSYESTSSAPFVDELNVVENENLLRERRELKVESSEFDGDDQEFIDGPVLRRSKRKRKRITDSWDDSDKEEERKRRPRRNKRREINYNENDLSEEEFSISVSTRGRLRRQRRYN